MPRQGESFHQLVERIQRAVEDRSEVQIESPKFLVDIITKQLREHDIVLTYQMPQWPIVVAIECRDRKRPVGVNQVEEFQSKCASTGVNRGIIVSSGGFTETAQVKAKHYGIDCFSMDQIEKVEWCGQSEMVFRHRKPTHVDVRVGSPGANSEQWRVFFRNPEGDQEVIANGQAQRLMELLWPKVPDSTSELEGVVVVEIQNVDEFYLLDAIGTKYPIRRLELQIRFQAVETSVPLTFYRFGQETSWPLYEVLIAEPMMLGSLKAEFMMIWDEKEGIRLQLTSE